MSPASGGWSDIDGATSSTLTVTPKAGHDGRQYRVVAKNEHGTVTTDPAVLTVHYAPELTSSPDSVNVNEGGDATFTASASANPAPSSVTWQRRAPGGSWQTAGAGSTSQRGTRATLELSGIDKSQHNYEYRAVFKNEVGTANSNSADLTVNWAPAIESNPADIEQATGREAIFTASAQAGNPKDTTAQWQVNEGGRWRNLDVTSKGTSATLTVDVTSTSQNNSKYRVVFKNSIGESESSPATLRVRENESGSISTVAGGGSNNLCVQPDGGSDGTLHLDSCSDPPVWDVYTEFTDSGPNGHAVRWADGRCMSVSPTPDGANFPVELRDCGSPEPSADQLWHFDPHGNGAQPFTTTFPYIGAEVCLDVEGSNIASGTRLIAYACHGGVNQRFKFVSSD